MQHAPRGSLCRLPLELVLRPSAVFRGTHPGLAFALSTDDMALPLETQGHRQGRSVAVTDAADRRRARTNDSDLPPLSLVEDSSRRGGSTLFVGRADLMKPRLFLLVSRTVAQKNLPPRAAENAAQRTCLTVHVSVYYAIGCFTACLPIISNNALQSGYSLLLGEAVDELHPVRRAGSRTFPKTTNVYQEHRDEGDQVQGSAARVSSPQPPDDSA